MAAYDRSGDIQQVESPFQRVKRDLEYKDEEALETGMEKVRPLEHLDGEIKKQRDQIQDSLSEAEQVNDDVPYRLLSQVNGVIEEARNGETTLFKASTLLEFTAEAFQYARQVARDRMELSHRYDRSLSQFDEAFTKMMSARLEANLEEAQLSQNKCTQCVECAVEEAIDDMKTYQKYKEEEIRRCKLVSNLQELQTDVPSSIEDEIYDLSMIHDYCKKDIKSIESNMDKFEQKMREVSNERVKQEKLRISSLERNRKRQADLERQLRDLKEEENTLVRDIETGRRQEEEAQSEREDTYRQVREWKDRIKELQHKVKTSLSIMDKMKGVTDLIITDALKKKRAMEDHLQSLEVEGLKGKRDALLSKGVLHMLIKSDCEINIKAIEEELKDLEKKKLMAARTMLKAKVDAAKREIEDYKENLGTFQQQHRDSKEKLAHIRQEMEEVDGKLRQRKPSMRLDSLEDRYKEKTKCMREK